MNYSTTRWAQDNGTRYLASILLDNHPVPREWTSVELYRYDDAPHPTNPHGYILTDAMDKLRDATNALYIIDNGTTAEVYYVAGYHPEDKVIILNPFPVGVEFGPRRTYHLRLTTG